MFGRSGSWGKRGLLLSLFFLVWLSARELGQRILANHGLVARTPYHDSEVTSDLAKVTMAYGDLSPEYERAIDLQMRHAQLHGYEVLVLRSKLLGRLYTKPAYILSILLSELEKPETEQLKWLFWFDLDIVLMNPNIPLEVYLPPTDLEDINLVVTNDHNGLNTGSFFVRISSWSAQLFADVLAMPTLRPEVDLKYSEQSALEILVHQVGEISLNTAGRLINSADLLRAVLQERNIGKVVWIPQRWINAYIGRRDERGELTKVGPEAAKKGDLHIHFAGKQKTKDRMGLYLDIAERRDPLWELTLEETGLVEEANKFWSVVVQERSAGMASVGVASSDQQNILDDEGRVTKDKADGDEPASIQATDTGGTSAVDSILRPTRRKRGSGV